MLFADDVALDGETNEEVEERLGVQWKMEESNGGVQWKIEG